MQEPTFDIVDAGFLYARTLGRGLFGSCPSSGRHPASFSFPPPPRLRYVSRMSDDTKRFKAIQMLKHSVELTLLGRKAASGCAPLDAAVRKYRWVPTLSHDGVLREMQNRDVLVLPSLFEGFGLVILEAMAQGTPVVTTAHTAGPDIIEDGTDGFIIPIRSAEAIAEKLDLLASDHERLMAMKLAAKRKSALCRWAIYQQRLVEVAREVIAS